MALEHTTDSGGLTPEERRVIHEGGTEAAFTGEYWDTKTPGTYRCRNCRATLFDSDAKYDSGTGWPSFYAPATAGAVTRRSDPRAVLPRTEVLCAQCDAHLGHVFDDGPEPTGERFCMNSAALRLEPQTTD